MRVLAILRRMFKKSSLKAHKARLRSVLFAVASLLQGGRLSLTGLGRSACHRVAPKHNIKRMDRLLGNQKLHQELPEFFGAIANAVIQPGSRPVILMDWTKIEYGKFSALTAAVPLQGRAVPIYWEVHADSKWGNLRVHKNFLATLGQLLPRDCRPILVTDAGFQNPWFDLVTDYAWDWVGRVGHAKIRREPGSEWLALSELFRCATGRAQDLGICEVARKNQMYHRVVLGKRYRRNPKRSKVPRRRSDRSRGHERAKRRNKEPWVLVTSLLEEDANKIQSIYARRMSIEECYRDTKNHRFGWSLEDARSYLSLRYAVLLLIGSLSMLVVLLVGLVAEQGRQHFGFQANTVRKTRVLSLFYLGKQILNRREKKKVRVSDLSKALLQIRMRDALTHVDAGEF